MKRTEHIVVTFEGITDAVAFEKLANQEEIEGRIIPLPPVIDKGCGICYALKKGQESRLKNLLKEAKYLGVYDDIWLF